MLYNNMNSFYEIQTLLREKADLQARINLIPYDGNPEIKENAYYTSLFFIVCIISLQM